MVTFYWGFMWPAKLARVVALMAGVKKMLVAGATYRSEDAFGGQQI